MLSSKGLGHSYSLPDGIDIDSIESKEYLADSKDYIVDEIEVFSVILIWFEWFIS